MRIGVFSDDGAGHATALLIALGLATRGEPVGVVSDIRHGSAWACNASLRRVDLAKGGEGDWLDAMEASDRRGADLVLALPLAALRCRRTRLALDAAFTVGWDGPNAALALREARFPVVSSASREVADVGPRPAPPWFLPCSHQVDLATQASPSDCGTPTLPFATRAVPFMVPRRDVADAHGLTAKGLPAAALRTSVLVASLVVAIAADPHAHRIEPATLVTLMAARDLERERAFSDRLLALSAEFERLEAPSERTWTRRAPVPPGGRRARPPCCPGRVLARRADCRPSAKRAALR